MSTQITAPPEAHATPARGPSAWQVAVAALLAAPLGYPARRPTPAGGAMPAAAAALPADPVPALPARGHCVVCGVPHPVAYLAWSYECVGCIVTSRMIEADLLTIARQAGHPAERADPAEVRAQLLALVGPRRQALEDGRFSVSAADRTRWEVTAPVELPGRFATAAEVAQARANPFEGLWLPVPDPDAVARGERYLVRLHDSGEPDLVGDTAGAPVDHAALRQGGLVGAGQLRELVAR